MNSKYFFVLITTFSLSVGFSLQSRAQLPVDPTVIHGAAVIDTVGSHMTVTNSPNAILEWQSFSIGANDSVYFQQQDVTSQVLNRVTGSNPSEIFGHLGSNGSVWLINPYGVLFGESARIDVAGLVASTLNISNIDFLASRYHFNTIGGISEVKNQGEIRTTFGGRVWMMGDRVHNEGLVETPGGQVVLAAGKSIELVDSGAPNVVVRVKAPENEAVNLGTLVASNGNIDLHGSIVNQEGIVRANSISTDAAGRVVLKADQVTLAANSQTQADNGSLQLEASRTLNNMGEISGNNVALAANEILQQGQVKSQGGSITLNANSSTYLDGSVDVSNLQGAGGNIQLTTNKLEGMAGGSLRADGVQGGHIRVQGQDSIAFSSTLAATGSAQGGKIEVTGDRVYLLNADIDASGGSQGGTVHLGGGWQGGGDLPHAREVLIGVGSEVKASGGENTNAKGGEISVFSTQSSEHYGLLQAKDGGRIRLASLGQTQQAGDTQVGASGTVLLDSNNFTIIGNSPDNLALARKVTSGSVNGHPKLEEGDNFGVSVAIEGDLLAVGAAGDSTNDINNHGAVHLFSGLELGTTGLTWQKILSSESGANNMPKLADADFFGMAVALDGDRLAVGARGAMFSEGNHGAVHLFTGVGSNFSGLTWQKKIASNEGAINMPGLTEFDFFGTAVALDGDRLVVGAAGDSINGSNRGAIYLFTGVGADFSTLVLRDKLSSGERGMPALADSDFFGWSLALDGDRMVVGAFNDSTGGTNRGAVHLFTGVGGDFSALTWRDKLSSGERGMPVLANSDFFGWSLALKGDRLVVGALGDGPQTNNHGAVHLLSGVGTDFSKLTWQYKIAPDPKLKTDGFGLSVALDDKRLAIGAIEKSGGSGAMYLFNLFPLIDPATRQETIDTSIQSVNVAASGTKAILDSVSEGRVIDLTSSVMSPLTSFGRLNLARMSREDMQQLIDYRKEFKEKLFADAIYKLELDPSLSDVPICSSLTEVDSGICRISDDQRNELKSEIAKERRKGKHKVRIASLPQIERKFIVLFGIDQYTDKTIPSLENAVADVEAIGQLFTDKLGYDEARIVNNAKRTDIIRTLNQLSIEMEMNDSVVVYYAGHGYLSQKTGSGYWIPADASAKDPETWISNTSISEMLASINSKQMVMISDSCYSGAFTKEKQIGLSGVDVKPAEILTKRSVVVMSSGGDEPVADEGREGHSIFAWYLMQVIRNVDNWKAGSNIFEQIQRDVMNSFPQTPQYGAAVSAGHQEGGDYLFEFRQLE